MFPIAEQKTPPTECSPAERISGALAYWTFPLGALIWCWHRVQSKKPARIGAFHVAQAFVTGSLVAMVAPVLAYPAAFLAAGLFALTSWTELVWVVSMAPWVIAGCAYFAIAVVGTIEALRGREGSLPGLAGLCRVAAAALDMVLGSFGAGEAR
jgi:hypothetical protein